MEICGVALPDRWEEFGERQFPFSDNDKIRSVLQIIFRVIGGLGSAQDDGMAACLRCLHDPYDAGTGDQVGIDAQYSPGLPSQAPVQRIPVGKSGIEQLDIDTQGFQIRTQIHEAEWCVRLHDSLFFLILTEKVTVG